MLPDENNLNLLFWNDLEVLNQNRLLLGNYLQSRGVDAHAVHRIEVVFDELVTNIIRHGYADDERRHISVGVRIANDSVSLSFDDDAREFDPTNAPPPDLATSIDQARPGGLGLLLLRRMSSEMRYERIGSRNKTLVRIGIRKASHSGIVPTAGPPVTDK